MQEAYIISTGSELLQGTTADSNAIYLAKRLKMMGIKVVGRITVGDDSEQIRRAFRVGMEAANLLICTGGLGPTFDDITKIAACEAMECTLAPRLEEEERIREFFRSRRRPMPDINLRQAMFPPEAIVLPNLVGTAPGMYLPKKEKLLVLLPGPPREMEPMFEQAVEPLIKKNMADQLPALESRTIKTIGMGESQVEEVLRPIMQCSSEVDFALLAVDGEVHIRLTMGESGGLSDHAQLDELTANVKESLGRNVFGIDEDTLVSVVARLLREQNKTLATAESCTGGMLGKMITDLPGSSEYYWGGVVTYSNEAKASLLKVRSQTLSAYGAVSRETAQEMAQGMLRKSRTDYALAITGVAGPGGGSIEKPVGLVYIALAHQDHCEIRELRLGLSRDYIRILSAKSALDLLRRQLQITGQ